MAHRSALVEDLRWKKFEVLDDGFVTLVDVMGDDTSIVQAARVSYGKDVRDLSRLDDSVVQDLCKDEGVSVHDVLGEYGNVVAQPDLQSRLMARYQEMRSGSDRKLIRYLLRHRHTTPFEMVELKFLVRVPMDCWRQWIRHRTANVNEYSTRYAEAIDSMAKTPENQWRLQSGANKQGSDGFLAIEMQSEIDGLDLSESELDFHSAARLLYQKRLDAGVAKEQARKDLPLSTYTEAYWKIDLHNLFHFLGLRMDFHAQKEIRDYATAIGMLIVAPLFPIAWEAFSDYRLNGVFLTRLESVVMQELLRHPHRAGWREDAEKVWKRVTDGETGREKAECFTKLEAMGFLRDPGVLDEVNPF